MTNEEFIESIKLDNEEWRDVVGYEGIYMVSSLGRLCCLRTVIKDLKRDRQVHRKLSKIHKVLRNGKHYLMAILSKDGTYKKVYMHRIVALSFIPNPNNYNEIDHIDTNGENNVVENLRWVTHKENQNNPNTKLNMSIGKKGSVYPSLRRQIVQIGSNGIVRTYDGIFQVKKFGFSPTAVSNVLANKAHSSGGYKWMYLSDYENLVNQ